MLSTPPAFILSQDQTLQFELGFSVFRARARLRNPARWNLVVVADSPPSEDDREPPKLTLVFLFYLVFKEPAARRFARSAQRLSTSGRPEIRAANRSRRLRTASNLGLGWTRERTGAEIVASVRLAGSFG